MKSRQRSHGTFEQTRAPLLFLAPNLIIFSLFIILPAIMGLRMSFFDWSILDGSKYIGFKNFRDILADSMFWLTLKNTLIYVVAVVPLLSISALALALPLAGEGKGMGVFRAIYYVPTMLSMIIVGIAWRWLLGYDLGIINYAIRLAGGKAVSWLTDGTMANISLIFVTVWTRVGYFMMMFIGGLQAIPKTYYEAAEMDGAGRFTRLRRITIPLLKPIILVVVVLSTIEAFKAYELIFVMTQGGPGTSTKFLVQYIYQAAFEEDRMGYGAAMSVILLVIIGIFTAIQFGARREEYTNE
ncbi:ABC-type transporter, integral membrane subunit [uncultured spirochete]|jgi:alpha-1,4-digalacturonate transport system permease protein|uniref:ABC-type transporter, integral membrane subunit n=1 Tax=uncultured spirochete TaxID=156406 RepID=A0A3P3XS62_9SPIR|nr:ABC-type transporter, integral membrane subunit [uncultured spirochete]